MADRVSYEDHIVDLFRKSQQDDLTGQVNLKSQYSMTKTFTKVVSPRLANQGLPLMMASDSLEDEIFGILNFGHWDLFEIWLLVLGILSMTQKDNELHATHNLLNFTGYSFHNISGQVAVRSYGFRQTVCCSSV
jgi:hypothetical protein